MEEKIWKPVYGIDGSVRMIQVPTEEEKPVITEETHSCGCCDHCSCGHIEDEEDWDWDDEEDEESSDKGYTFEDIFSMDKYITHINESTAEYLAWDTDYTVVLHAGEVLIVGEGDVHIRRPDDEVIADLLPWDLAEAIM